MKYLVILSAVLLTQDSDEVDNYLRLLSRYYNHSNIANFFSSTPADETELVNLKDCDFEDYSMDFKKVACSIIIHITDVIDQNIEYRNYLHVTFILEALESFNIFTKYLGMTGIQVRKIHDVQDGSSIYKMGDMEIAGLMNGIAHLEATLQITDPLPVGISIRTSTGGRSVMMAPWFLPGTNVTTDATYLLSLFRGKNMNLSISYHEFGGYSGHKILPYFHTTSLEYLKLSRGNLRHSPLLSYQPYLINLNVADCNIEWIRDETFYATPNLKHLNLADNLIDRIPPSISTLVHLETLDLSHNPLIITQELDFTLPLHHLQYLQILHLSHIPLNNLDLLQPFLFSTSVRLSELHITNCNISVIPDNEISMLEHQTSLKVLDMSNNELKYIPSNFVQSLKRLKVLNLSSNHLYESPQLILDSNLTILDLSYNNLTVPVNITHLGTVELLNLSRNNITTWNNLATSLSTNVTCLNISHNFIEVLSKDMIDFFKTMQCVDLGGNPLNCQICDIQNLRDWYRQEEKTRVLSFNTSGSPSCSVKLKVIDVGLQYYYCADEAVAAAVLQSAMVFSMVILAAVLMWGYKFEVSYFAHLLEVKCDWLTRHYRTFQFDAFICYSEADRGFVFRELVQHLENGPEKYKLCLQERDFVLGRYITQNIMNFLQESRKIIVVITSNFINNQWCNWELEMVKHKLFEDEGDFLIFLDLEHVNVHTLPRHLRYLMSTQAYIKWPSPCNAEEATWTRLKAKLGDSLYMKKHGIVNT